MKHAKNEFMTSKNSLSLSLSHTTLSQSLNLEPTSSIIFMILFAIHMIS